jgi:glutamine amidotransferase
VTKIVIVDYGSGNLRSVQMGLARAGFSATISHDPQGIADASHLIVPGVGAFSDCMRNLSELDLLSPIRDAIRAGKPYLGICLGFQILFTEGMEFGSSPGLNLVAGSVVRFPEGPLKVPHMGWNQIRIEKPHPVLEGVPDGAHFYFVHSYYPAPTEDTWVAATTEYGVRFPSAIGRDNLFACQFHPEKSQSVGQRLLGNFARLKA